MTAAAAAAGMIPEAFEWAVGLERLYPLAVVTIGAWSPERSSPC